MQSAQVKKQHYEFDSYSFPGRWVSYYHQVREVLHTQAESVLEVGIGDSVLKNYIQSTTAIEYQSLDIAADLKPDIVGSVTNIPLKDNSIDVVCAFEVLEHLPFSDFPQALKEMARVAKSHVLISLPHYGPTFKCSIRLPLLSEWSFLYKIPFPIQHVFNGEHYWEIGKRSYGTNKIRKNIASIGTIYKEFIPFESPYHHFFSVSLP